MVGLTDSWLEVYLMLNVKKKHRIVVLIQQYLFLAKINLYEKGLDAGIINFVEKKPYYF
jgi:hypothetical protein